LAKTHHTTEKAEMPFKMALLGLKNVKKALREQDGKTRKIGKSKKL
jgi:hypothetical protein